MLKAIVISTVVVTGLFNTQHANGQQAKTLTQCDGCSNQGTSSPNSFEITTAIAKQVQYQDPTRDVTPAGEKASSGDPKKGKLQFIKCRGCHTLAPGERHMVGPNLGRLFGAEAASKPNFQYSDAMKIAGITWTDETLDRFIEHPEALINGTAMVFSGIKNPKQRADLITYLKTSTQSAE